MRLLTFVLTALVCLAGQAPRSTPSAQQKPVFRVGVDARQLDVVVLNRHGRPIHGLTAADFTILEDGQPQRILASDEVVVATPSPAAPGWVRDVAPDVTTNDVPTDGRLMVIVMDDAVTRDPTLIEPARRIGREIVRRMGPADLASVVFTLDNQKSQDFTGDRPKLLAAIERFSTGFSEMAGLETHFQQATVKTITKIAEALRTIEGRRKALLYVSAGVPMDWAGLSTPVANLGDFEVTVGEKEALRDLGNDIANTLQQAALSNMAVYSISPRGLTVDNRSAETDFLHMLSSATGGIAIVETNAPEQRIEPIFTATSAYYLLAYEIQRPDDGRYRKVEVKVNRPDATVHARKGFYARAPQPARATGDESQTAILATAMAGFLPKGDIPMRAVAMPFAQPGKAEVVVAIAAQVEQEPVSTRTLQQVELLTTAFDQSGKAVASTRQTARVTLLPADSERARYDVLTKIQLKPGRYSLRIAAHNTALAKSGSVFTDVEVPDVRKREVWMSGVALHVSPGIAASPRNALQDTVSVVPTTVRTFASDDTVTGAVQILHKKKEPFVPVRVDVRIVDDSNRTIHRASDTLDASRFVAQSAEYQFSVPVGTLKAGYYLLTIEASGGEHSTRRDVRFAIGAPDAGSGEGRP